MGKNAKDCCWGRVDVAVDEWNLNVEESRMLWIKFQCTCKYKWGEKYEKASFIWKEKNLKESGWR